MQSQDPSCLPREMKPRSAVVLLWAHQVLKVFQHPTAVVTGRQLSSQSQGWDCAQSSLSQYLSLCLQHCQYLPTCTSNIL